MSGQLFFVAAMIALGMWLDQVGGARSGVVDDLLRPLPFRGGGIGDPRFCDIAPIGE